MKAGWEIKTLNEISTNLDNKRVPITKSERTSGVYPYYGASGIVDYVADYIFDEDALLISEDGANLLARSTPIAFPATGKYWVNNHAHILKFESMITQRFVELYLESIPLDEYITGAAQPKLNQKALNSIPIPVPPLPEQQRIVAILDEAFAAIAAARANAEQNRQNARALFESYLQSVFSQRGEGWVETTVGHQVDFLAGFAFKSSEYTDSEEGVRLVRGDNIVQGELRWVGVKRWPINDAPKYSQFFLNENDVVLAMDRPWVAAGLKVAFITKSDLPSLQVQRTARLRAKSTIHWKYLFHMLRSPEYVSYLLDGQTGLGVPHISGKQILSFEFPLPPLNEQQSIVQRLDALWEDTQRLESLYQRKIEALDELTQSLLQQAFSGNL
ncbi:restriction endonuclease subunit S [Aeromonas salmonicida]|uniref:restriction endonuclease subunit S n=1 Tax=Aeromonas salmonicida TaxID=645 RepID=UPI003D0879A5